MNEADLVRKIQFGNPEEKEIAAEHLCRDRMRGAAGSVIKLLQSEDPLVRGIAVIILGVLGVKKDLLNSIHKSDESPDVQLAAEVMLKYFGNISYIDAKNEISIAKYGPSPEEQDDVGIEKQAEIIEKEEEEEKELEKKHKRIKRSILVLITAFCLVAAVILIVMFSGGVDEEIAVPEKEVTFADQIRGRIEKVAEFKKDLISYRDDPTAPNTIFLRSYSGDTYGSLFEKIYDVPDLSISGMNTIFSFFRKYNFTGLENEKDPGLFEKETINENLIFPNLEAMNLRYDLIEGSAAYEALFDPIDSLEISITIEMLEVK